MKSLVATLAVCLLLSSASQPARAQSRTRRAPAQRRTSSAPRSTPNRTQTNAARIQLSDQIKNLTRFIYLYGRLSKDLEVVSAQAESADVARRTKASLIANFANLREGLDQLERQFRFTPGLEGSYPRLQGAAAKIEEAEASAAANQFDRAGRQLVEVVSQLTDVLVEM